MKNNLMTNHIEENMSSIMIAHKHIDEIEQSELKNILFDNIRIIELVLGKDISDCFFYNKYNKETCHPVFNNIVAIVEHLYRNKGNKRRSDEMMLKTVFREQAKHEFKNLEKYISTHKIHEKTKSYQELFEQFAKLFNIKGMLVLNNILEPVFSNNKNIIEYLGDKSVQKAVNEAKRSAETVEMHNMQTRNYNFIKHLLIIPCNKDIVLVYKGEQETYFKCIVRNMIELNLNIYHKKNELNYYNEFAALTLPKYNYKVLKPEKMPTFVKQTLFNMYRRNYLHDFGIFVEAKLPNTVILAAPTSMRFRDQGEDPFLGMVGINPCNDRFSWGELYLRLQSLPITIPSSEFERVLNLLNSKNKKLILEAYEENGNLWIKKNNITEDNKDKINSIFIDIDFEWDVFKDNNINKQNAFEILSLNVIPLAKKDKRVCKGLMQKVTNYLIGKDMIVVTYEILADIIEEIGNKVKPLCQVPNLTDKSIMNLVSTKFNIPKNKLEDLHYLMHDKYKFMVYLVQKN